MTTVAPLPQLSDMPHNIFELILAPLDMESRLKVQLCSKKCKALSDVSTFKLRGMAFHVDCEKITFMAYQNDDQRYVWIYTPVAENRVVVKCQVEDKWPKHKLAELEMDTNGNQWFSNREMKTWHIESNYVDAALRRLQMYVDNPKLQLYSFDLRFIASSDITLVESIKQKVLALFVNSPTISRFKFGTNELKLTSANPEEDCLVIFEYLKPNKLEQLELDTGKQRDDWPTLGWEELIETEMFKGLQSFKAHNCWTTTPYDRFENLVIAEYCVDFLKLELIERIVEQLKFAQRPYIRSIKMKRMDRFRGPYEYYTEDSVTRIQFSNDFGELPKFYFRNFQYILYPKGRP